jgi:peptidoglycan/xylan/chitin deacetylase (PgdA/CDA1 family)
MSGPSASSRPLAGRVWNRWRRFAIEHGARRDFTLETDVPYVSFTFDDFPRTALTKGGEILRRRGVRGTYFVSMQLLGKPSPSGPIATTDDVKALLADGHELGCHTYEHLDGCNSSIDAFERSIRQNRAALADVVPAVELPTFAYPLDGPVLSIKRAVGTHFVGCRGGGQTFNSGVIDLNLLKAYFLDWRNRGNLDAVREVVDRNAAARGWLIFATHDVAAEPSRYGCLPEFFEEAVRLSIASGARVVPMMRACEALGIAR